MAPRVNATTSTSRRRTARPRTRELRSGDRSIPADGDPVEHTSRSESKVLLFWRSNSLSLVLLPLFVLSLSGQIVMGWFARNSDAQVHGETAIGLTQYLGTGHFWEATGENWESEFLQMAMFVLLTVFLRQKGSAESKRIGVVEDVDLDARHFSQLPDAPGPVRRGGFLLRVYEHSLGLTFGVLFLISIVIHALGGLAEYNSEQLQHGQPTAALLEYTASSQFWFESLQNWQSEFLSIAAMVIATIYLRERGSAESKPVYASHDETGR